jgi:regulator of replication initiation timing
VKSALKEWGSRDAADIMKNAIEELKKIFKNGFQECFKHFYNRWQTYIVAQEDCFEENVAYMIILFCISQK